MTTYIETAIQTYLSSILDCQVWPQHRPQGSTLPAVTYRRTNGGYYHDLDGAVDFANPYFEFEIFSNLLSECWSISQTIRKNLQGYSGTLSSRQVYCMTLTDETDDYFPPVSGKGQGIWSTTQTYRVMYREI